MKQPELSQSTDVSLSYQVEAIRLATGIDSAKPNKVWDPDPLVRLPPKALWQTLMARYAYETGIQIGDPAVILMKPNELDIIEERIDSIKRAGKEAWVGSATWADPTNWDTRAPKTRLWKDIKGRGEKSVSWDQFVAQLETEKQSRRGLILKTFPQNPNFKILNIRMQPGSIWQHPEGWSIHIEWYQTTDAREGDENIPRSFLISSDPQLCVVCGKSTRGYAQKFLNNNLSRLQEIISFWGTLHHPPATLECMRQNGKLIHLNDVAIELPPPSTNLQDYLMEYETGFIQPLYGKESLSANISDSLNNIHQTPWVTAKEWNIYRQNRDFLWNNATINEGEPENSKDRAQQHSQTVIFERRLQAQSIS